ncbi:hypothetical protein PCE1_002723 [Barthelona sp. PCE]
MLPRVENQKIISSHLGDALEKESCTDPGKADDSCGYVNSKCSNFGGHVNLLKLRFCSGYHPAVFFIFIGILMFFMFTWLSIVADKVLAPALLFFSNLLNISPSLASLTIVAFSNGSADLFSTFRSSNNANADLAVGEILGSTIFCISIIIAAISLVKSNVIYPKKDFLRDVFSLFIASVWVTWVLVSGTLHFWQALISLILYSIIVYFTYTYTRKDSRPDRAKERLISTNSVKVEIDLNEETNQSFLIRFLTFLSDIPLLFCPDEALYNPKKKEKEGSKISSVIAFFEPTLLLFFVFFYLDLLNTDIYFSLFNVHIPIVAICSFFTLCSGFAFHYFHSHPSQVFYAFIRVLNIVFSVMASDLLANEIVSVLQALGVVFHIDGDIMGVMVLSPANGVADLVADMAIARSSNGILTALSSCLLNPLVNLLAGLFVFITPVAFNNPVSFTLSVPTVITMVFLFIALLSLTIIMSLNKFRTSKGLAYISPILYVAFLVTMVWYTLH